MKDNQKVTPETNIAEELNAHPDIIDSHEGRRQALKKIGKFTAYAAPAGIALLSSKAAYAS